VAKKFVVFPVVALVAGALLAPGSAAQAAAPTLNYTPVASWWGTNGRVTDIVTSGDRVYLGGGFDYIGPQTGYGAGVSGTTGAMVPNAPMIDGAVYASVADGAGGWYVAGAFTTVGGVARKNAAQIGADGVVSKWNPKPNGAVYALAMSGGNVVLGGAFTQVGKTPVAANRIGEVDASGGSAVGGFSASANSTVRAVVPAGSALYVAGDFTTIGASNRSRVARIDAATGAVDNSFAAGAGGPVSGLALSADGSTLYGGGSFSSASGPSSQSRGDLAAWATADGSLTSWSPVADAAVEALAVDPASGSVYAGGLFGNVNGTPRSRLAGIDTNGAVTAFDPALSGCQTRHTVKDGHSNPVCTPEVSSLNATGGTLYVGGRFGQSGATTRHDVAGFALADGSLTGWNPVASDRVLTLGPSAGNIFVGGELTSLNGLVRKGVAALTLSTGVGDPTFTATTDDEVLDLQLSPDASTLYLAGHFSTVNGLIRKHLASVSTATGAVTGFQANTDNDVLTMAYAGGALYAGGQFIRVNGIDQGHMTKVDPLTGAVNTTFSVNVTGKAGPRYGNGMVEAIVASLDGTRIFMGGPFTTLNGNPIALGIVAVDANSGALLAKFGAVEGCQPRVGPWINRMMLTPDGTRLIGGDICPDRIYVWDAINMTTAQNPTGLIWKSACNGGMQGILVTANNIYYGTHGTRSLGTSCWASPLNHTYVARSRYAVFDLATGVLLPDNPQFGSAMGVWSIAATPQGLIVGGDFDWVGSGNTVRQGLALFPGDAA
jgi:hypothetical protein